MHLSSAQNPHSMRRVASVAVGLTLLYSCVQPARAQVPSPTIPLDAGASFVEPWSPTLAPPASNASDATTQHGLLIGTDHPPPLEFIKHSDALRQTRLPPVTAGWSPPADSQQSNHQPAELGEFSVWKSPFELGEGRENGELASREEDDEWRLITKFEDGVAFASEDDEFELRIRIMEQTDFKYFLPDNQEPARPGLYIPRFRTYFEGHVTQSFEYELSLQRSVEGTFDVLDANINFRPADAFQVKLGRMLVPYSYDWYDHLEQFFITPERGLFPLNFGLSREAGIMLWGELNEGRFEYAVGGFSGQLAGLADTNTTRDAVVYVNARTLGNLNFGGSIALGTQAFPAETLPLRTSIQASENDEAANAASSVFLEFEDDVLYSGARRQAAIHAAWYGGPFSVESEFQAGEFRFRTPDSRPLLSATGYHVAAGCFLTGEEVTDRSIVVPHRPFDPASGNCGPGAIEAFCRFSYLNLDENVFTEGLANPDEWTRQLSLIDLGWNWYPNRYIKFYFDWQMSLYDTPVLIDPETGETTRESHLFWLRGQVFF